MHLRDQARLELRGDDVLPLADRDQRIGERVLTALLGQRRGRSGGDHMVHGLVAAAEEGDEPPRRARTHPLGRRLARVSDQPGVDDVERSVNLPQHAPGRLRDRPLRGSDEFEVGVGVDHPAERISVERLLLDDVDAQRPH
jgi:hypothetical protein